MIDNNPKVLFICTGNYYRSRYAEIMFNHYTLANGLDWSAFSRGILASNRPWPISQHARKALENASIPLIGAFRFPLQLSQHDFEKASRIVVMYREEHYPLMQVHHPEWLNKVEFWHVPDIDVIEPKLALPMIEQGIAGLLDELMPSIQQYGT